MTYVSSAIMTRLHMFALVLNHEVCQSDFCFSFSAYIYVYS